VSCVFNLCGVQESGEPDRSRMKTQNMLAMDRQREDMWNSAELITVEAETTTGPC
jgi:IS5 family transposase